MSFNLLFLNGFPPVHVAGIVFNNVTWSLLNEMVFYVVFPVVLLLVRYSGAVAGALPTAQVKAAAEGFPDVAIVGLYCFIIGLMTTDSINTSQFAWCSRVSDFCS